MRLRVLKSILLILLWAQAQGNFAEFFGASTSSAALGGQGGGREQAGQNYYAPALISYHRQVRFSFSSFYISHHFKDINNVVIRNSQNSVPKRLEYGPIKTDYGPLTYGALHLVLPIMSPNGLKLGLSLLTPLDKILKAQTGDPFLTEYVMYRSRPQRPLLYVNLAGEFPHGPYAWSLGFFTGAKVESDSYGHIALGEEDEHSYARIQAKVSPTLGGLVSLARRDKHSTLVLGLQQEMKSQLSLKTDGMTIDPPSAFGVTVDSLTYYDPYLLRLSYSYRFSHGELYSSLEYQYWKNYLPPLARIHNPVYGTIRPSLNFEKVELRNILIPKLGFSVPYNRNHKGLFGVAFRPTPLSGNFSGPGNSVDTDKIILAAGHQIRASFLNLDGLFSFSVQYHHLISQVVRKTPGTDEEKIGSPHYNIGGHVLNASLGFSIGL